MLRGGELEGIPPEESGGRGWKIPMHPVHDRDRPARVECPSAPAESPERLSDLEAEVSQDLRYQFGLSRGRIELTERRPRAPCATPSRRRAGRRREGEGPGDGHQSAAYERVLWRFPLRAGDPRRTWGAGAPVDVGRPRASASPFRTSPSCFRLNILQHLEFRKQPHARVACNELDGA